ADFAENPRNYDIPDSVIAFLSGQLGVPPGGWPEPFRTKALEGRKATGIEVEELPAEDAAKLAAPGPFDGARHLAPPVWLPAEDAAKLAEPGATRRRTLNRLLFPGPTTEYEEHVRLYGDTSVLHTRDFLYGMVEGHEHVISLGKGVRLLATLQAVSEA